MIPLPETPPFNSCVAAESEEVNNPSSKMIPSPETPPVNFCVTFAFTSIGATLRRRCEVVIYSLLHQSLKEELALPPK